MLKLLGTALLRGVGARGSTHTILDTLLGTGGGGNLSGKGVSPQKPLYAGHRAKRGRWVYEESAIVERRGDSS